VLFARDGIMGGLRCGATAFGGGGTPRMTLRAADAKSVKRSAASRRPRRHAGVAAGARHALIGPNGAGKTTLINLLTGVSRADVGRHVILGGEDVTALPSTQRVKRGLARTFQINRCSPDLTVLESVTLAVCERRGLGGAGGGRSARHAEAVDEAARCSPAAPRRRRPTSDAQPGLRQAAADRDRAGAGGRPRVLLLDEPAAGVPTGESRELFETIAAPAARRDDRAHRARHGPRVPLRRPHLGAGQRRAADRGHVPEKSRADPRVRQSISARPHG
jgi:ABC-type branched-subunit amino acid transport system ATPase component